jgi:hypothetical protein
MIRANWLANRIFQSNDDLAGHACAARRRVVDRPWRVMAIGLRGWAWRFWSMGVGVSGV